MTRERKPLLVEGYTVPFAIEDAVLTRIRTATTFTAGEVIGWLLSAGVPPKAVDPRYGQWGPGPRIADRMLQRERRAGRIFFDKARWSRS